jgi:phosphinothricin acetyltransferase
LNIEPYTVERRAAWFEQFAQDGRYRLLVAEENGVLVGYSGTTGFRPKAAYDPTVETTIYFAPEAVGQGIGSRLSAALLAAIVNEAIHQIVAGFALPNAATQKLLERFGFRTVGIFRENGRKFGRYWDVCWCQRPLRLPESSG